MNKTAMASHALRALPRLSRRLLSTAARDATGRSTPNVVIVDGVRLPFALSSTIYEDQLAVDLQRLALNGLVA